MRSNQYTTRAVISAVKDYLDGRQTSRPKEFGTTVASVVLNDSGQDVGMMVTLCDNPILRISKKDEKIDEVFVFSGFYYDKDGNPTHLTRERLNGLLDFLGDAQVIPEKTRVVYDKEYGVCYVNCGESRAALNRDYSDVVGIKADPAELRFLPVNQVNH